MEAVLIHFFLVGCFTLWGCIVNPTRSSRVAHDESVTMNFGGASYYGRRVPAFVGSLTEKRQNELRWSDIVKLHKLDLSELSGQPTKKTEELTTSLPSVCALRWRTRCEFLARQPSFLPEVVR